MAKRNADSEAQPSSSIWGDMFGLGPMFKMLADPQLADHAHAMMQAIIESASASARIERKLNFLLEQSGNDPRQFDGATPALLTYFANHGAGGFAPASSPAHDGIGAAAGDNRQIVDGALPRTGTR